MFGSAVLEVALGLIFVYLVLSLICSAIREAIEAFTKTRATDLHKGIRELLQEDGLVQSVYGHPLLYGLYVDGLDRKTRRLSPTNLPSYIPGGNFALALLDIAARGSDYSGAASTGSEAPELTLEQVRASLGANIPDGRVRRMLLTAVDRAGGDLQRAQEIVEAWFDSSMDRVSGWYKRRTQLILFVVGAIVAVAVNANTFAISIFLYENETARTAVASQAETFRASLGEVAQLDTIQLRGLADQLAALEATRLPVGWSQPWPGHAREHPEVGPESWFWWWEMTFAPLFGWLATALAISLGAPFWFDLLNKVMVIRSTVKPQEKSPAEASEDRQPRGGARRARLGRR